MVEILAGGHFERAVQALDLTSAICTYHYTPPKNSYREDYQVWELSDEDFSNLCSVNEEDWNSDWETGWGWWRYAEGSSLGATSAVYAIHGVEILAWDGYNRLYRCRGCESMSSGLCLGTDKDLLECYGSRSFPDLITYLNEEIGASTERNVCACTIELAKQNNMKLSELFKKYLG